MSANRNVSKREWDRALNNDAAVSRLALNQLVMDYLVVEGYQPAAEAFARETGLQPGVNLSSIARRMRIRTAIQAGDIEAAITMVQELDPWLLDADPPLLSFRLQQLRVIELIRQGRADDALTVAAEELAPLCQAYPSRLPLLERTMALLVFGVPAAPGAGKPATGTERRQAVHPAPAHVAELLGPHYRMQVAGEVNAAILAAQSESPEPKVLHMLRMLVFAQDALGPHGPGQVAFPALALPAAASAAASTEDTSDGAAGPS